MSAKTIQMPKELLEKWLAALRSGEWEQGREYLCSNGKFCCLGVLVAVSGKSHRLEGMAYPLVEWQADNGVIFRDKDGTLRQRQPFLPSLGALAGDANDGGASFAQIADAIEACAEGV